MKFSASRQALDVFLSLLALGLLSPFLMAISLAILCETGRPVFFTQNRVGKDGKVFRLVKFRSMRAGAAGSSITARGDSRITRVGKILRKFKLDELPQFWNVVRGDMSIVGPRPEVPEFVDATKPIWRSVLSVRPGITDPASVAYRNEEELLAKAADRIRYYEETLLPAKLAMNVAYIEKRSLWEDVKVIARTAKCAIFPSELDVI
jgi:lipopolysaccharide/colanic/teichoic acid biosynthesis glycosyltransferase